MKRALNTSTLVLCIGGLCLLMGLQNCSKKQSSTRHSTYIEGRITVADSVDQSGDYSGIHFSVIKKDSASASADTLAFSVTDKRGYFEMHVPFERRGRYRYLISRNDALVAKGLLVLSTDDTLRISAELPAFHQTKSFASREYEALNTYERVERNFSRVSRIYLQKQASKDSLKTLFSQWSELYWQVYEKYSGTLAADLAAGKSLNLLSGFADSLLLARFELVKAEDELAVSSGRIAADAKARLFGLSEALAYLRKLETSIDDPNIAFLFSRDRVEMLYDSTKIDQALKELNTMETQYPEIPQVTSFVDNIKPQLTRLAPGKSIPRFQFVTLDGVMLTDTTELGSFYVLEFASVKHGFYQNQLQQINITQSLYKPLGFKWITVALDGPVTLEAFVDEWSPPWSVVTTKDGSNDGIINDFNLIEVPTRYFVNKEGKIIRRYQPAELDQLINDILRSIQSTNPVTS